MTNRCKHPVDSSFNYSLKDLLDIARLRTLLDSLGEIDRMPSAIIDMEGNVLTASGLQNICTKFHRLNSDSEKLCIESDRHIKARLDEKSHHVIYRCPMGLVDAVMPIIIEGKHIGNVFTGQIFTEPPDEEYFKNQANKYSFDENGYLEAMRKVPLFTEAMLHKNLKFIHALTQMLAEQGLQYARQFEVEEKLRESEAKFRSLFEDAVDPVSLLESGRFIDCNTALLRMFRYPAKQDFLNLTPSDISPEYQPDGRTSVEKASEMIAIAIQNGYHRFEWMHTRADGSLISIEVTLTPISVDGKELLHTIWRDITERKLAEARLLSLNDKLQDQYEELQVNEELLRDQNDELLSTEEMLRVQIEEYESAQMLLKESEERFMALSKASFGGVIIHDKGIILECNEGLSDMTGYTYSELLGMNGLGLIAPEWLDSVVQKIQSGYELRYEVEGLRKNGSRYPLAIKGKNVFYKGREVRVIEFRDISERKLFENELLKVEKLESLGVLAGGIAHDFNNILTGILGNISFALMFIDPEHNSFKRLAEAEKASVRAGELAQQLLTFARGGEPVKKVVAVKELLLESVSLILSGSNVKGNIDIPDSLFSIEADGGQISQVFNNIIINATQAMPGGGTLYISASNENLDFPNFTSLPAGAYVRIYFTDHGCGISADVLNKIFDPYFTTKSSGNGLGLASANSIISRHGGNINAISTFGKGTTFTIYLPSAGKNETGNQLGDRTQDNSIYSVGFILVMDDEALIRELTTEMLEYLGYRVKTCEDGAEAVALYKTAIESGTPFAAVVMDLTIPAGMGGKETALHILDIDPSACLIVSSGYSNDPIMADYKKYGFAAAIAKPYTISEFGRVLGLHVRGKDEF
jgi:PAS domain S-box-containing protein